MNVEKIKERLLFIPLGGVGEIGMNLSVYGYGTEDNMQYLIVDMGVSFADEEYPGADLIMPDISFLESEALNIVGLILTHGHEDHYGAVADLWRNFDIPVYCTDFTAHLLENKYNSSNMDDELLGDLQLNIFKPGEKFKIGDFAIDTVVVNHSIPEAVSLVITTPLGSVVHTGDWKIDHTAPLGDLTDIDKFKKIGKKGVLALLCDSTNAMQEGDGKTEDHVKETIDEIIGRSKNRVAVTTFSSNIGRIKSIIKSAIDNDRKVLVIGRSLKRSINIALELGYIEDESVFLTEEEYNSTPRDKVVVILTGSQGEDRAALSKLAAQEIKALSFTQGDIIIYSSRMIPGNEKKILSVQNKLVDQGVKLITSYDEDVHVSGHAKRDELEQMYNWLRPEILVPVHGHPMHLEEHANFARKQGIKQVLSIRNGDVLRLAPGKAEIVDKAPTGLIFKDGKILGDEHELGINARRRLSRTGFVTVVLLLSRNNRLFTNPRIIMSGVPKYTNNGQSIYDLLGQKIDEYLADMPKNANIKRKSNIEDGCVRCLTRLFEQIWGKRPIVSVVVNYI